MFARIFPMFDKIYIFEVKSGSGVDKNFIRIKFLTHSNPFLQGRIRFFYLIRFINSWFRFQYFSHNNKIMFFVLYKTLGSGSEEFFFGPDPFFYWVVDLDPEPLKREQVKEVNLDGMLSGAVLALKRMGVSFENDHQMASVASFFFIIAWTQVG